MTKRPHFAFCADDFTGASDTLATLVRRGLAARLYLRPPNQADNPETADLDAIGVATSLRSMSRAEATPCIRRVATGLASLDSPLHHLKICSTFDSSPHTGNVAVAADAFADAIGANWIAVIGGQPSLGRYCLFGNLFAAATDGAVHRIDRHPTMSVHPITPMAEADLRLHLQCQGWDRVGLVAFLQYRMGIDALVDLIEERRAAGETRTLFDVSCDEDLALIGAALRTVAAREAILCVGASSVAEALCRQRAENTTVSGASRPIPSSDSVFAFAGSRSSVTAEQIRRASSYEKVPLAPSDLQDDSQRARLVAHCRKHLAEGTAVLAHLVPGENTAPGGRNLAEATAGFVEEVVVGSRIGCLAIAGGDTSSAAVERLGIDSISMISDLAPGAPLVRAHSGNALDGLPMVLKGGQMGGPDFFEVLVNAVLAG